MKPRQLETEVGRAVDLLKKWFAKPSGTNGWKWTTKVLWVLPHKQVDAKKGKEVYVKANGNLAIQQVNCWLRRMLHYRRMPYLDMFGFTVGREDHTSDGTHYPPDIW